MDLSIVLCSLPPSPPPSRFCTTTLHTPSSPMNSTYHHSSCSSSPTENRRLPLARPSVHNKLPHSGEGHRESNSGEESVTKDSMDCSAGESGEEPVTEDSMDGAEIDPNATCSYHPLPCHLTSLTNNYNSLNQESFHAISSLVSLKKCIEEKLPQLRPSVVIESPPPLLSIKRSISNLSTFCAVKCNMRPSPWLLVENVEQEYTMLEAAKVDADRALTEGS